MTKTNPAHELSDIERRHRLTRTTERRLILAKIKNKPKPEESFTIFLPKSILVDAKRLSNKVNVGLANRIYKERDIELVVYFIYSIFQRFVSKCKKDGIKNLSAERIDYLSKIRIHDKTIKKYLGDNYTKLLRAIIKEKMLIKTSNYYKNVDKSPFNIKSRSNEYKLNSKYYKTSKIVEFEISDLSVARVYFREYLHKEHTRIRGKFYNNHIRHILADLSLEERIDIFKRYTKTNTYQLSMLKKILFNPRHFNEKDIESIDEKLETLTVKGNNKIDRVKINFEAARDYILDSDNIKKILKERYSLSLFGNKVSLYKMILFNHIDTFMKSDFNVRYDNGRLFNSVTNLKRELRQFLFIPKDEELYNRYLDSVERIGKRYLSNTIIESIDKEDLVEVDMKSAQVLLQLKLMESEIDIDNNSRTLIDITEEGRFYDNICDDIKLEKSIVKESIVESFLYNKNPLRHTDFVYRINKTRNRKKVIKYLETNYNQYFNYVLNKNKKDNKEFALLIQRLEAAVFIDVMFEDERVFATIHDSFICRKTDVDDLLIKVKNTLFELYNINAKNIFKVKNL